MIRRIAALLVVGLTLPLMGGGASAADVRRGEQLARRLCADCHVVTPAGRRGTTTAPPFADIARRSGLDATQLAFYLLLPHPKMPNRNLSQADAVDIAAYIVSGGRSRTDLFRRRQVRPPG